jgi:hypothetical protein
MLDAARVANIAPDHLRTMRRLQTLVVDAHRVKEFERALGGRGISIQPDRRSQFDAGG